MNTSKSEEVNPLIDNGLSALIQNLEHSKGDQLAAYIAALGLQIYFDADVNGDGVVNAVDVQLVINAALGLD